MSDQTILVIDDSATIRKLVDNLLSPAGYRVALAPTADDGLRLASEVRPDLILLDHQLPGVTGYDVCRRLAQSPELREIPVVVSSTLRKKAYADYLDLDNVVDMLPKPYSDELLLTTVSNALQTAAMVVDCQSQGTSVPEVIHPVDEDSLSGSFGCFGLREVIDFLNNGCKAGVLQVEAGPARIRFYLQRGRIQGVDASGLDRETVETMINQLPESLTNLAPILRMTVSGKSFAGVDGFVQLLNQRVLDPRLMIKLLRFQAAMLVRYAFTRKLSSFHFDSRPAAHSLFQHLPLDLSLLALLVDGSISTADSATRDDHATFARRIIRGQNLDRTGLSPRHMKILSHLADPKDAPTLAATLEWPLKETQQVLDALVLAELIEARHETAKGQFVVYEPDRTAATALQASLERSDNRYQGEVVSDKLALQRVLKQGVPHTFVFAGDEELSCKLIGHLFATQNPQVAKIKRIAMVDVIGDENEFNWSERVGFEPHEVIVRPCTASNLFEAIERVGTRHRAGFAIPPMNPIAAIVRPVEPPPVPDATAGAGS